MSSIKRELDNAPSIKVDPDIKDSPMTGVSDELDEDAGDLDFSNSAQSVWLSRIPRALWENWNSIDEDEEVQIGTIRIEGTPDDTKRVRSRLLIIQTARREISSHWVPIGYI